MFLSSPTNKLLSQLSNPETLILRRKPAGPLPLLPRVSRRVFFFAFFLLGRDFTWSDIYDRRQVAVVSENLAREMWGEPSAALGKRIRAGKVGVWNEIIGVVGDVYDSGAQLRPPAIVYWRAGVQRALVPGTSTEYIPRAVTFAIRSDRAGTEEFVKRVNQAVWTVNPTPTFV